MVTNLNTLAPLGKQILNHWPTVIQDSIRQSKRIILVANNPSITTTTLNNLLEKEDMIVLFNHFIHADYFATNSVAKTLPKLLCFRQIGDSKLHFGLPPRRNNLPQIEQMSELADVGFLLSNIDYQYPTLADDPSPDDDPIDDSVPLTISDLLVAKLGDPIFSRCIPDHHEAVADYPVFEGIHSSAASSGFFVYRLMLAVRSYLLTLQAYAFEIVLIGFNHNQNTTFFWQGHNWEFERNEMSNLPDGVRIIKQF